jgi:hypothetical protein
MYKRFMNVKVESQCDLEEDPCVFNQYKPTHNEKSGSFQA